MQFNILSLSGGGYMGLYSAYVLAALEEKSGKPLRDSFDLIAGTSVGGIIAMGIALGVPVKEIVAAFEDRGVSIFSDRSAPVGFRQIALDVMRSISGAKYSNEVLRETVESICGATTKIEDIPWRFIAPAVNLTRGMPHTFRTPHLVGHSNSNGVLASDVALATSAAPTLLPLVKIGDEYFSDGGTYANSPDQIALHEAESLIGVPASDIHMLSIGTTTSTYQLPEPKSTSLGLMEWMEDRRLVRMMLATQQQSVHRILSQRLKNRYIRLDADQGQHAPYLGLDYADTKARGILQVLAEWTINNMDASTSENVQDILKHTAAGRTS